VRASVWRVVPLQRRGEPDESRRWWTLAALCCSLAMIVMDGTILNVALPTLVTSLGASSSELQWIVDAYTLVFAGLLLASGSLGDRFGRRRMLNIGVGLFIVASVAGALQTTAVGLIGCRCLTGIAASMVMPSTLSILTNVFRDQRERGRAIGVWSGFASVGVAAGPIVGGLLLRNFSWSAVFWVNAPIGLVALVATYYAVPESKNDRAGALDPLGALLSIAGLVGVLYSIIEAPARGWASGQVLGSGLSGIAIIGVFVAWELHTSSPMLDVRFYRNRRFAAANSAVTLAYFALFGSLFLMTQFWQFVKGYTPLEVGVRLIPYAASMSISSPISSVLVNRFGSRNVMMVGFMLSSCSFFGLSHLHADSSYPRVILNMLFTGVGIGLSLPPATAAIMGSLPRQHAGVGSAVNDTTRNVGGSLGVAVIGSIMASTYVRDVRERLSGSGLSRVDLATIRDGLGNALSFSSTADPVLRSRIALAARESFVSGFSNGMLCCSGVMLFAAVLAAALLPARAIEHEYVHTAPDPVPPVQSVVTGPSNAGS